MKASNNVLIAAAFAILVLIAAAQYNEYVAQVSFKAKTVNFFISPTVNFTVNMSLVYNNSAVANNTKVCRGTALNVTPVGTGIFSVANSNLVDVRCPTGPCEIDSSVVGPITGVGVRWFTQAYYNSLRSSKGLDVNSWCKYDVGLTEPWALTTMDARYFFTPNNPVGGMNGLTRASVYCNGALNIKENGSTISGGSQDMNAAITNVFYTPSLVGLYTLRTDLDISDCSMFVHSYETIDGDVYQCIYPNTGALTNKNVAGDPFTLEIVSGPVFSVGSIGNVTVTPSSTFIIIVPLNNTGDANATITSISLNSGATVITVNSFNPTVVNVSQPVNLIINATAPALINTYPVNLSISYTSSLVALGDCANNTQGGLSLGTIIIGDTTPPVTTITGIQSDGSGYQFNDTAFLPPPLNLTLSCNDGAGFGCNTTYYCIAKSSSGACSSDPSTINTIYTQQYNVTDYGTYTTCFYSNDLAGNNETPNCETIIIEEPKALTVHIFVTPSGILKDAEELYPGHNVSINVSIRRDQFSLKIFWPPIGKNITIYRLNPNDPNDRKLVNKSEENVVSWEQIPDEMDDDLIGQIVTNPPLVVDVTNPTKYFEAVYQVEVTMYDPLLQKPTTPASAYFVIYSLSCADKG